VPAEPHVAPAALALESGRGGSWRLSFRNRIVALLVLLVLASQLATFVVVNIATGRSVELRLQHDLAVGERVWRQFHQSRGDQLLASVAVLSDDFGFKDAVASGDPPTIASALGNHAGRVGAAIGLVLAPDGQAVAGIDPARAAQQATSIGELVAIARREGEAVGIVWLGDAAYQVAVVPMMAPTQIAWIAAGDRFDAAVVREYRELTGLDASVARRAGDRTAVEATTLEPSGVAALQRMRLPGAGPVADATGGDAPPIRILRVSPDEAEPVFVLLQASLEQAMAPFLPLKARILILSGLAAVLALVVAGAVGRGVSRPVAVLAGAAARIEQGDYSRPVPASGSDELARLARAFNRMQAGIAQREERIVHQAGHDALTGLPNRARALQELEAAIGQARDRGGHCAVLMLDIDRFKEINDTLGHGFGDQVLVEASKRLAAAARPGDLVARLGGDEFLVLLRGIGTAEARRRAEELAGLLREPLRLPSTLISLEVSVGVAVFPEHADEAQALLRRVDIAMYEAKQQHAGVAVYVSGRDELHLRQVMLMADLRRAVDRGELHVVFQPKIELSTRSVHHAEALLRWTHPELGPIRPDEFIPLAERSGYVRELSRYVLDHAISQCRRWRDAGLDLGIAVNLSAVDLMDVDLPDYVYLCLRRHGVAPERLILEVTESALMRDVNYAIRVLQRLRSGGVRIAIDDFGTGHSSLAQLRKLPVDELKIDKSFVMQLAQQAGDAAIVRATIDLGHHMGLRVIAEGVEDARSLALLSEFRCDMAQGYLFSAPLESVPFAEWCRHYADAPAALPT
jgi:diguanylate cyclase (GGDEF)-like protein